MNSRTWSKDTSFSSRSVSALFQLTGCQTWQMDGKMVRWSDEMPGVYEAGFLPLYMKSENHNHVINILNVHLESGHWCRGSSEDVKRNYIPVSNYKVEWAAHKGHLSLSLSFFFFGCIPGTCGILVSQPGIKALDWKCRVLNSGLPGKSPRAIFSCG